MVIQHPCSSCKKSIHDNHKSIYCDYCNQWIHYKCNLLNLKEYNKLVESNDNEAWYCINCIPEIFPFAKLNKNELNLTLEGKNSDNFEHFVLLLPPKKHNLPNLTHLLIKQN